MTTPDRLDVLAAALSETELETVRRHILHKTATFGNYTAGALISTIDSLVADNKALRDQVTHAAVLLASMRTGSGDMTQELWQAAVAEARALIEQAETDDPERAAVPTEPDHALHFDPDCEECLYLARPVAIHVPPSPDRGAGLRALHAELEAADEPAFRHVMQGSFVKESVLAGTILPEWLRLRLLAALIDSEGLNVEQGARLLQDAVGAVPWTSLMEHERDLRRTQVRAFLDGDPDWRFRIDAAESVVARSGLALTDKEPGT